MPTPAPVLPEKPRRRGPCTAVLAAIVVIVVVVGAVVLSRHDETTTAAAGGRTVRIGVADKSLDYWKTYVDLAASKLDVTVDLVNFSDYTLANPALSQGEIDLNQFQHVQYLANYDVNAGDDLQPIGATAIYPLPLYSTTAHSPAELADGASVVIPDDDINEARGLLVLQSAGLLTLKDGGTAFSTIDDIETTKVKVTPVDASQTASALQSGSAAAAIVNVNYATSADLPTSDVIAQDDPSAASAAPYVNVFAARKADISDPTYLALAQLFQDPQVQAVFAKDYPNAVVKNTDPAQLQSDLTTVEADARAAKKP